MNDSNDNIRLLSAGYSPGHISQILRWGLDIQSFYPDRPNSPAIGFLPTNPNTGLTSKRLDLAQPNHVLLASPIFPTDDAVPLLEKVAGFFEQAISSRANIIAVPIQLKASGHFIAIIMATQNNHRNVVVFNTEGTTPLETKERKKYSSKALARFDECWALEDRVSKVLLKSEISISWMVMHSRLQDPNNEKDYSCGPRVIAGLSEFLTHPEIVSSRSFDLVDLTVPMAGWKEISMREIQARIFEERDGYLGYLKHLHLYGAVSARTHEPVRQSVRPRLYQRVPTI